MTAYDKTISREMGVGENQVLAVGELLSEGATIPFIARYRKERTGGLDEVQIASIRDRFVQFEALDKRREAILKSLNELGVDDADLLAGIETATSLTELEDLYLPHRPKRRTRGTMAREKGLAPLAELLMRQGPDIPERAAGRFINDEKGVATVEEALAGARDIIAEKVNENADARRDLRGLFSTRATVQSKLAKGKEGEGAKYTAYHDWSEPLDRAPSHRILAVLRGAAEGVLRIHFLPDEVEAVARLERRFVKGRGPASEQVRLALQDAYKRLLGPSLETEARKEAKERADGEAISVFARNLRHLLLAPPLGEKRVLALDPGFRTGCKLVCLNEQGELLHNETIYPLPPQNRKAEAEGRLKALVARHAIEAVGVGNGTGGREAEAFCRDLFRDGGPVVVSVNESGASVYSASQAGRDELPEHDVTVRGAVSIGRRLQDPLAELVKIDPKSIGVGQYQHDVDQKALQRALDDMVASCVNAVGVTVNTASARLLVYVSGLSEKLAGNVITHRNENGPFPSRASLKKVKGLGPKAFEQCAGFLRITGAKNPLDDTAVHPESYGIVREMAKSLDASVKDLIECRELRARLKPADFVTPSAGLPTVTDILEALEKAGRDPRERFDPVAFQEGVSEIGDLEQGMMLPGIVTNVTAFGAFVDIGVHHDGLVHISQMADRFVRDPHEIAHVGMRVNVRVVSVDLERKRIGLSMKGG